MGRGGWPVFTQCLPVSATTTVKTAQAEMQGKGEATEVAILNSLCLNAASSDNLRKFRRRQELVEEKKSLAASSLVLALLGIALMVLHTELLWFGHCEWVLYFYIVKCTITLSTGVLLILIIAFHTKEIQLFISDNSLDDWQIAMNTKKMFWILLELVVCSLHPFPVSVTCDSQEDSSSPPFLSDTDTILSIMMFMRIYLLPRTILLHSRVLVDASYRSIGSLNKIKFQYQFVLKILMNTYPGRLLLTMAVGLWLIASWTLSVCERQNFNETDHFITAMWLIPITFLTIGYGDVVPSTICGRVVCLCTGVMGVGCTALLVAVAANKLEFTKAEKHVHNFMLDINCMKQIKCAAANVLREAWLVHKHAKRKEHGLERKHQRNLLRAIHTFRRKRLKQRTLQDQVNSMVDISKMQMIMYDLNSNLNCSYLDLEKRIDSLDKKLDEITRLMTEVVQHQPSCQSPMPQ